MKINFFSTDKTYDLFDIYYKNINHEDPMQVYEALNYMFKQHHPVYFIIENDKEYELMKLEMALAKYYETPGHDSLYNTIREAIGCYEYKTSHIYKVNNRDEYDKIDDVTSLLFKFSNEYKTDNIDYVYRLLKRSNLQYARDNFEDGFAY